MTVLNTADDLFLGDSPVDVVYLGSTQVWPPPPFSPSSVPGLHTWLDAQALTLADGAVVASWPGVGHDAVASEGAVTYAAAGINGHPSVRFGEVTRSGLRINLAAPLGDRTIFQVIQTLGSSWGQYHTTQVQELDPYIQTYGPPNATIHTYTTPDVDSGVLWSGQPQFITLWNDTAARAQSLTVDGHTVGAGYTSAITSSASPIHVGSLQPAAYGMNGWIGEMIFYDRHLTDAEIGQVQDYLAAKWELPDSLWTPANIPGLAAWFDPAQDLFADGERITSYVEHSPNRLAFTGYSAGAEPVFRAGGQPYIEFQGAGHLQYDTWNAGPVGLTFVAVNSLGPPAQPMMLIAHHSSNDGYEMRWDSMNMLTAATWQTNFVAHTHTVADQPDVKQSHMWRFDVSGNRSDSWVGEAQESFTATVMPNAPSWLFLGVRYGGYFYTGKVYEALVFEGAVSDADLARLRNYLTAKHGL